MGKQAGCFKNISVPGGKADDIIFGDKSAIRDIKVNK